jgi:hypothetical protein
MELRLLNLYHLHTVSNDCPIAVGVENPHEFWMRRQPRKQGARNVKQTSRHIFTTASFATNRRYGDVNVLKYKQCIVQH